MDERKTILSTLWIFVMFNYVYADILILTLNPSAYQHAASKMSTGVLLAFSALMEVPMVMIFLSRILKYRANRLANIIAGSISTAFVAFTLSGGQPTAYYLFFSVIEIACTVFIIWYAWAWRNSSVEHKS